MYVPHNELFYRETVPSIDFVVHHEVARRIRENWIRSSACCIPDLFLTSDTLLVHQQFGIVCHTGANWVNKIKIVQEKKLSGSIVIKYASKHQLDFPSRNLCI